MKEVGTAIMIFTLALSVIYLIAEKLIVRAPLPQRLQHAYLSVGVVAVFSSFSLYFAGS